MKSSRLKKSDISYLRTIINKVLITFLIVLITPICSRAQKNQVNVDSLKYAIDHTKPDTTNARALYNLAQYYLDNQPDSSSYYANRCLKLVTLINWEKGIGAAHNLIGNLYLGRGDHEIAIKHYQISYLKARKIGNEHNMTSGLINIGSAYQHMANLPEAVTYTEKALKLAKESNDEAFIAICYGNLSDIFLDHEDYAKSLYYNEMALALALKVKDLNGIANIYLKIANTQLSQHRLQLAKKNFQHAFKYYNDFGNEFGKARVFASYAMIFEEELGKEKKMSYLLKAQDIFNVINPKSSNSISNIGNIGGTYAGIVISDKTLSPSKKPISEKRKDELLKKAIFYLEKAIAYSKETKDLSDLSYYSDNLAQVQEFKGDYKNALANFKIAKEIDDSLYSQQSKNKIAKLESQKDLDRKDLEIAFRKSQIKQVWIYGLIAIIFLISITSYILYGSRMRKLRFKSELERLEAEDRAKDLHHKNKLTEIELKAIRLQMNPHFIFNVLNSIEAYVVENDSKTASRLIQKFASLNRLILENSTQSLVSAEREFKALQLYTELEAIRFDHHFSYDFEFRNNSPLHEIMIPPMLIQPLIENSIHHGLKNQKDIKNHILIKLEELEKELILTVKDNGIGLKEAAKFQSNHVFKERSLGIQNIEERLKMMSYFHRSGSIVIKEQDNERGTTAILKLPLVLRN